VDAATYYCNQHIVELRVSSFIGVVAKNNHCSLLIFMFVCSVHPRQILLGIVLALRYYVAGIIIGVCAIPTYGFHLIVTERFGRAYRDAALLQTSHLDGWGDCSSQVLREEYRRWLVDCHKASYVPTCLVGSSDGVAFTSEPAVVVPRAHDVDAIATTKDDVTTSHPQSPTKVASNTGIEIIEDINGKRRRMMERQRTQRGVMFNPKYQ
jgi:hypothetical protein